MQDKDTIKSCIGLIEQLLRDIENDVATGVPSTIVLSERALTYLFIASPNKDVLYRALLLDIMSDQVRSLKASEAKRGFPILRTESIEAKKGKNNASVFEMNSIFRTNIRDTKMFNDKEPIDSDVLTKQLRYGVDELANCLSEISKPISRYGISTATFSRKPFLTDKSVKEIKAKRLSCYRPFWDCLNFISAETEVKFSIPDQLKDMDVATKPFLSFSSENPLRMSTVSLDCGFYGGFMDDYLDWMVYLGLLLRLMAHGVDKPVLYFSIKHQLGVNSVANKEKLKVSLIHTAVSLQRLLDKGIDYSLMFKGYLFSEKLELHIKQQ